LEYAPCSKRGGIARGEGEETATVTASAYILSEAFIGDLSLAVKTHEEET
jgi:hypothetical protein